MKLIILTLMCLLTVDLSAVEVKEKNATTAAGGPLKVRWLVTHAPNDYFVKMAQFFKERVEARTEGRVQIEILDAIANHSNILENYKKQLSKYQVSRKTLAKLKLEIKQI